MLPVMVVTIVLGSVVAMGIVGYLIDKSGGQEWDRRS